MKENDFPVISPLSGIVDNPEHTPEPWGLYLSTNTGLPKYPCECIVINTIGIKLPAENIPSVCVVTDMASFNNRDRANARRIIACVNACAGIKTENLESGSPEWWGEYVKRDRPAMEREISRVRLERDELLAGIKALYKSYVVTIETARDLLVEFKYPCDSLEVMEKQNPALKAARDLIKKIES